MIKKIFKNFLTFCVIGLGIINFSYSACQYFDLDLQEQMTDQNKNGLTLKPNGNFLTNLQYKFVNLKVNSSFVYNYFWLEGGFYQLFKYNSNYIQGFNNNWCLYNEVNNGSACYSYSCSPNSQYLFGNFYNDPVYSNPDGLYLQWGNGSATFCFAYTSLGQMVCSYYFGTTNDLYGSSMTGSLGFTSQIQNVEDFTNSDIKNYVTNSPLGGSGGGGEGGGEDDGGDEDYLSDVLLNYDNSVNWFEKRYGWSSDICYAGIDDCTTLYGSPVSFQNGSGLDIFELYSCLYNTGIDLSRVYVWLNTWLINNEQWLGTNGNPDFLASYNTGLNKVDLDFTNLSVSPFVNKPVALYFLTDHIERYSESKSMGSTVVSYCNLILNPNDVEDKEELVNQIIDNSDKISIVDQTAQNNVNQGKNPDGSEHVVDYSQFGSNTGSNWYGSGNGSTGQVVIGSGVDIAFSGNTTIKNTLTNFFDETKSVFEVLSFNTNYRILPSYLATAFIFVVLFKFLRKK